MQWSRFGREEKSRSGDMEQSLSKKGLFSAFSGKFTKKTLARVYYQVVGGRRPWARDLQILVVPLQKLIIMKMDPASRLARAYIRVSQVRVKRLHFL
jgi:hypothetical protein